jgi:hypothetical protein
VQTCIRALDPTLDGLTRKHSPPAVMIALVIELNRLGEAHISAGLLTAANLRKLVTDACEFMGAPELEDAVEVLSREVLDVETGISGRPNGRPDDVSGRGQGQRDRATRPKRRTTPPSTRSGLRERPTPRRSRQ